MAGNTIYYPVKKVCSFFYTRPLEHCTVFSNCLLDVQRAGNMGTSFFTPLWQIERTSLVIAALKENDNFLYPQKKVYVTFEMCRSSKKSDDLYSRRAGILKRRPCSTFIQPLRQSNTSRTSVWVKRFRKYRSVRRSARKCNASRMQTTLEWISELVCSALTCCWK